MSGGFLPVLRDTQDTNRLRLLCRLEILSFFRHRRSLHVVAMIPLSMFLSTWFGSTVSPWVPMVIVFFAVLEPQFDNILFGCANEFEVLWIMPTPWREVLMAKNIATLIIGAILFVPLASIMWYFSPSHDTITGFLESMLWFGTVLPAMLASGNIQSIRAPRRESGFRLPDAIELCWILVSLAIMSVPYAVMTMMLNMQWLCIVYAIAAWWWYLTRSVPRAVRLLDLQSDTIFALQ